MGKIKGWKLREEERNCIIWDNLLNPKTNILVTKGGKGWNVHTHDGERYILDHHDKFKTKTKAKKFAINWMKKHPRG